MEPSHGIERRTCAITKPTLTAQPNKSALSSFCKSGPWKIRRLFANSTLAWYSASRMVLQAGANARTPSHLSPIKDPDRCPHCNSKRLIKKGTHKKKHENVPLFLCRSCGRKFTVGPRTIRNKTYPLPEILEALSLYDRGNTLEATAEKISSRYGHRVAASTISRWLSEHPSLTTYRRLRERGRRLFTPTLFAHTSCTIVRSTNLPTTARSSLFSETARSTTSAQSALLRPRAFRHLPTF